MTRWARIGYANKKKELSATPWESLQRAKPEVKQQNSRVQTEGGSKFKAVRQKTSNRLSRSEDTTSSSVFPRKSKPRARQRCKKRAGLLSILAVDDAAETDKAQLSESDDNDNEQGVAELLEKGSVVKGMEDASEDEEIKWKENRREKRRLKRIDKRQSDMVRVRGTAKNCPKCNLCIGCRN